MSLRTSAVSATAGAGCAVLQGMTGALRGTTAVVERWSTGRSVHDNKGLRYTTNDYRGPPMICAAAV